MTLEDDTIFISEVVQEKALDSVFALAQGKSTNYYSPTDPSLSYTVKEGDCWFDTDAEKGEPTLYQYQYKGNNEYEWVDIGGEIVANKVTATFIDTLDITTKKIEVKDGQNTIFLADAEHPADTLIGGLHVGVDSLANDKYTINENGINFYSGKLLLNNNVEIGTAETYDYIYTSGNKPLKIYNSSGAGIEFSTDSTQTYTAKVKTAIKVSTSD